MAGKFELTGLRTSRQDFAYLRALADNVDMLVAARQYLGIDHAAKASRMHHEVVDRVRAVARRRQEPGWRLIGAELDDPPTLARPSIEDWAESQGLAGWAEAELLEMYTEAHPVEHSLARRLSRNARLRARRLDLLRRLETVAYEPVLPSDRVSGLLPPALAAALERMGVLTMADLRARIGRGGRWWVGLPAYGPVKARRLVTLVDDLMGGPVQFGRWLERTDDVSIEGQGNPLLSGERGRNRATPSYAGTAATDDRQAIEAWIAARAGSPATARMYRTQAERFLLFCLIDRKRAMADATVEDCRAYVDLLEDIPDRWVSLRKVTRLEPGWAPFKGQLSVGSRRQALGIVSSLFTWLVSAGYLQRNPWALLNIRLGDDPHASDDVTSRAFTPQAWKVMMRTLDEAPPTPATHRLRWICEFVQATGLRAAELVAARVGHLKHRRGGWLLAVHGKGSRNRQVVVPTSGIEATRAYLALRGTTLQKADPKAPLLASVDGEDPITYSALYQTFTRFVRRAAKAAPMEERDAMLAASTHWLRHTHATRAVEREVPPDVLQAQLGQSDPRTTARYYKAQLARRQEALEKAFASAPLHQRPISEKLAK